MKYDSVDYNQSNILDTQCVYLIQLCNTQPAQNSFAGFFNFEYKNNVAIPAKLL